MLDVVIRPRAQLDLESIYTYIAVALGSPQSAEGILEALYQAMERIAELPDLGTLLESERLSRPYRRVLVKNYWVYYSTGEQCVTIWRILHTRQDIDDFTLVEF